ncbi:MAG: ATP-binding protein, partial [Bacteroidia bacterium]
MRPALALIFLLFVSFVGAQPYYLLDSSLNRGYSYLYMGKYDLAGKLFFQALKKAQIEKNKRIEAESYRLLGEVNRASSNRPAAIKYLDKAELIFNEIQDDYGVASTKNRKAAAYYEKGDSINYMKFLMSSLKISRDNHFRDIEYNSLTILGAVQFSKARDYQTAVHTLTEAMVIARELNKVDDFPYIYTNIAGLYLSMNQLDSALVYGKMALEIAESRGIKASINTACSRLASIHAALGNFDSAFIYERRFNLLSDTLNIESRDKQFAELVEKYEDEKNIEALEKQRLTINYILFAAILFLIVLVFMFILFGNLRTQRKMLTLANEKMEVQNAVLGENSKLKDRLLSVLSHDLRSPMAALSSSLELIRNGEVNEADSRMIIEELSVKVERTSELLDNLLFWIKNQLNRIAPEIQDIHLAALIRETLGFFTPELQQKELHVQLEVPDDFILNADKEMIRLVIRNLISNAVKFSKNGGQIRVGAAKQGKMSVMYVEDDGIGINAQELKEIFQMKTVYTLGTK